MLLREAVAEEGVASMKVPRPKAGKSHSPHIGLPPASERLNESPHPKAGK